MISWQIFCTVHSLILHALIRCIPGNLAMKLSESTQLCQLCRHVSIYKTPVHVFSLVFSISDQKKEEGTEVKKIMHWFAHHDLTYEGGLSQALGLLILSECYLKGFGKRQHHKSFSHISSLISGVKGQGPVCCGRSMIL